MFSCFSRSSNLSTFSEAPPRYSGEKALDSTTALPRSVRSDGAWPAANFVQAQAVKDDRAEALQKLRIKMEARKLDVYVIPSQDEHLSEMPPKADRRREFITGFDGSAGTAVIFRKTQKLYVDSRYWIQAPQQVSSDWVVQRVGKDGQVDWDAEIVALSERANLRVGIDPRFISAGGENLHNGSIAPLLNAQNVTVVPIRGSLVDAVWKDQPARSEEPLDLYPLQFAGIPASQKLADLSKSLSSVPGAAEGFFCQTLDEIAWVLNLRSQRDIPFVPIFPAYLWIPMSSSATAARTLFVPRQKISPEIQAYLTELKVDVQPYEDVWPFLESLGKSLAADNRKVLTGQQVSWAVELAVGKNHLSSIASPILIAKAKKNDVELEGMRRAYLRDGRATVRWIAQLDKMIRKDGKNIDEWEAAEMLTQFRSREEHFRGLAYDNISGSGPNGALPHYSPVKGRCKVVDRHTPYVNDSGAQYLDGTIDTTRTWMFGRPTDEQKRAFTCVLQGHIAVDSLIFPEGTTGVPMDILARKALWANGLNFGHGTGHGIGAFLSVHEGPVGIPVATAFEPGHIISNEPGFYVEGSFGCRVESAIACEKTDMSWNGKTFLRWRRLTRVPIERSLVDFSLLTKDERHWLDAHQELCRKELLPLLQAPEDKLAREWLKRC